MKAKASREYKAGVHTIPCKDLTRAYIDWHLKVRLSEHENDIKDIKQKKRDCIKRIDKLTRSTSSNRCNMLETTDATQNT